MRYVFILLAVICSACLTVAMVFENLAAMTHNLFYKTKRPINWNAMDKYRHFDDTERFYHD